MKKNILLISVATLLSIGVVGCSVKQSTENKQSEQKQKTVEGPGKDFDWNAKVSPIGTNRTYIEQNTGKSFDHELTGLKRAQSKLEEKRKTITDKKVQEALKVVDAFYINQENIDVIEWVADPAEFIYNAIAPAEVDQVIFNAEDNKRALVVVPDNKLSLAIGRRGQNVRLAAHLTGYRIDIKSASEFEAMEAANELGGFGEVSEEVVYEDDANLTYTDRAMEEMAAAALATDLEESEVTELD